MPDAEGLIEKRGRELQVDTMTAERVAPAFEESEAEDDIVHKDVDALARQYFEQLVTTMKEAPQLKEFIEKIAS